MGHIYGLNSLKAMTWFSIAILLTLLLEFQHMSIPTKYREILKNNT